MFDNPDRIKVRVKCSIESAGIPVGKEMFNADVNIVGEFLELCDVVPLEAVEQLSDVVRELEGASRVDEGHHQGEGVFDVRPSDVVVVVLQFFQSKHYNLIQTCLSRHYSNIPQYCT